MTEPLTITQELKRAEAEDSKRGFLGTLMWYGLLLLFFAIIAALISIPVYFIPKNVGDNFAEAFTTLDLENMENELCDGQTLAQFRRDLAQNGDRIFVQVSRLLGGGALRDIGQAVAAGALRYESSYNILTSDYTFNFVVGTQINLVGFSAQAGTKTPDITIRIHRDVTGLSACVKPG